LKASGVIPIAHKSGGPLMDIVLPRNDQPTGYLAQTAEEYADFIEQIFQKSPNEREAIQLNARLSAERFSDEMFSEKIMHTMRTKFGSFFQ
jgi:alpha-1,2-mannosyltransferase